MRLRSGVIVLLLTLFLAPGTAGASAGSRAAKPPKCLRPKRDKHHKLFCGAGGRPKKQPAVRAQPNLVGSLHVTLTEDGKNATAHYTLSRTISGRVRLRPDRAHWLPSLGQETYLDAGSRLTVHTDGSYFLEVSKDCTYHAVSRENATLAWGRKDPFNFARDTPRQTFHAEPALVVPQRTTGSGGDCDQGGWPLFSGLGSGFYESQPTESFSLSATAFRHPKGDWGTPTYAADGRVLSVGLNYTSGQTCGERGGGQDRPLGDCTVTVRATGKVTAAGL